MKKNLVQIILIFFTIILIIYLFFYFNFDQSKKNQIKKEQSKNIESLEENNNLIQGIEYVSKDASGNIYKIIADNGKNDLNDGNLIYLGDVVANIKLNDFKEIEISSDFAEYNNLNNYTEFYDKVILKFQNNKITCGKIILDFDQGFAYLSDNIIFKNLETAMFLDKITIDLKNQTTSMGMFKNSDKIRIISNNASN